MPFKSKAQQRWMYANEPEMAKKWSDHTPDHKSLPTKTKKKRKKKAGDALDTAWKAIKAPIAAASNAATDREKKRLKEEEQLQRAVDRHTRERLARQIAKQRVPKMGAYDPLQPPLDRHFEMQETIKKSMRKHAMANHLCDVFGGNKSKAIKITKDKNMSKREKRGYLQRNLSRPQRMKIASLIVNRYAEKKANEARVQALVGQGMSPKGAIKNAYPDWDDNKVSDAASKFPGMAKAAAPPRMPIAGAGALGGIRGGLGGPPQRNLPGPNDVPGKINQGLSGISGAAGGMSGAMSRAAKGIAGMGRAAAGAGSKPQQSADQMQHLASMGGGMVNPPPTGDLPSMYDQELYEMNRPDRQPSMVNFQRQELPEGYPYRPGVPEGFPGDNQHNPGSFLEDAQTPMPPGYEAWTPPTPRPFNNPNSPSYRPSGPGTAAGPPLEDAQTPMPPGYEAWTPPGGPPMDPSMGWNRGLERMPEPGELDNPGQQVIPPKPGRMFEANKAQRPGPESQRMPFKPQFEGHLNDEGNPDSYGPVPTMPSGAGVPSQPPADFERLMRPPRPNLPAARAPNSDFGRPPLGGIMPPQTGGNLSMGRQLGTRR